MNILYIWDADYPWDIRVEKICNSLNNHGHHVHIASRNLKKKKEYECLDGLHIHRLKPFQNNTLNYIISFPLFCNPVWKIFLDNIIRSNKINCIIVRDLPLAIAGIWAGKRHGIGIIFDMAENYVAMIRNIWNERKYHGLNLIIRNPYLAKIVERYAIPKFNYIIVVVDEAIDVVVRGGGDRGKITIVGNTPNVGKLTKNSVQHNEFLKSMANKFTIVYVGGIQMGRGLQTVFDAIPEIVLKIPDFLFAIIGTGYASEKLKTLVKDRQLEKYVLWVGWVDHKEIFDYLFQCKAGIIPHFITDHVATTIPNKIFDYMAIGLPVVASHAPPLKRIITEEKCGVIFEGGNSNDLASAIIYIHSCKINFGKNGRDAIEKKFNWRNDEGRLFEVVDKLKPHRVF